MISMIMELASMESPSDEPESQRPVQALLTRACEDLGFRVRKLAGETTGGILMAVPRNREKRRPAQLLMGHCDTVWKSGTLETMPVVREGNRLRGPGVFDMKAGLVQMIFALRILRTLGLEPPLTPVILVNSDEETGSLESKRTIAKVARRMARAFIPEPAMGEEGKLKTVRKGVLQFEMEVTGKAAHAGLDPEGGASAVLELSHLIQTLHGMTDLDRGISLNVGVVSGGTRANVTPPSATAEVDVRILSLADGEEMEERVRALTTTVPGTTLEITRTAFIPPLEANERNRALWERSRETARELGMELEEVTAGGGSDGNTTSRHTATLDGLGAVGDGAHAAHEFLYVDRQTERVALLARLLMMDP